MKFSSFAVFEMVLEDANERFAPLFQPVQERVDILKQYCGAIDKLIERGDGEIFECEVGETDMTVRLDFVVTDVTVNDPRHDEFQQLLARALSASVKSEDGENIRVHLVFPSLWEKI